MAKKAKEHFTFTWTQIIPKVGDWSIPDSVYSVNQQSEVLKRDYVSLVDRLLDMGKRLIIAGPLPPPRYGDITTSRLRQLHLWLKGYCLKKSILFVDNFTAFLKQA